MATNAEAIIPDLLMARLSTLTLSPALEIAWPNVAFSPVDGVTHLEAEYLPNANGSPFLAADDESLHMGIFQVTVVSPLDQGIIAPSEIAGEIVSHFACGTVLRPMDQSFAVKIYEKPSVSQSLIEDKRVRTPVSIRWRTFV